MQIAMHRPALLFTATSNQPPRPYLSAIVGAPTFGYRSHELSAGLLYQSARVGRPTEYFRHGVGACPRPSTPKRKNPREEDETCNLQGAVNRCTRGAEGKVVVRRMCSFASLHAAHDTRIANSPSDTSL